MKMLTRFRSESKSQFLLIALLLLLLPLLAALQYRWLGQLSARESEQMKASLRATALRFSEDFDEEITDIYAAFLPLPEFEAQGKQSPIFSRYERWKNTATHPELIQKIFLVHSRSDQTLQLSQLNPAANKLEAREWPEEMHSLREQLEQQYNRINQMLRQQTSKLPYPVPPPRFQLLSGEPPALVIPGLEPSAIRSGKMIALQPGFSIVVLNQQYIQQEVLPALVRKHFTEGEQSSYELGVTSESGSQLIYQNRFSDPAASAWDRSRDDTSLSFFSLRIDRLRLLMKNKMQMIPPETKEMRFLRQNPSPGNLSLIPPMLPMLGFIQSGDQEGIWQLHLRHRAGSLATAVASVRRRNLIISFSILAVLAASISLLVVSVRRARRLAQQQLDFVAGVSHELRTPLAVIDSAGYNLARGVIQEQEQVRSYGVMIRKQTRQLKEMVEQVLEFSGTHSGRQQYELQPVSLRRLLEEFLTASAPLLNEAGFHLETEMAAHLPDISADASALTRALQNLLNNAMKYSGESRWIGFRAETDASGSAVIISISDRGTGISAEDLPHIFEPFYRGTEARASQIHGNGLGLNLVKTIIERHHGSLAVSSQPGNGSVFQLRLPAISHASESLIADQQITTEAQG